MFVFLSQVSDFIFNWNSYTRKFQVHNALILIGSD